MVLSRSVNEPLPSMLTTFFLDLSALLSAAHTEHSACAPPQEVQPPTVAPPPLALDEGGGRERRSERPILEIAKRIHYLM